MVALKESRTLMWLSWPPAWLTVTVRVAVAVAVVTSVASPSLVAVPLLDTDTVCGRPSATSGRGALLAPAPDWVQVVGASGLS